MIADTDHMTTNSPKVMVAADVSHGCGDGAPSQLAYAHTDFGWMLIPHDQLYIWSERWQSAIATSKAEIEAGHGTTLSHDQVEAYFSAL